MITISLEPADNGLIKFLIDDNVNGGGEEYTSRVVYEFEGITGFIENFSTDFIPGSPFLTFNFSFRQAFTPLG